MSELVATEWGNLGSTTLDREAGAAGTLFCGDGCVQMRVCLSNTHAKKPPFLSESGAFEE